MVQSTEECIGKNESQVDSTSSQKRRGTHRWSTRLCFGQESQRTRALKVGDILIGVPKPEQASPESCHFWSCVARHGETQAVELSTPSLDSRQSTAKKFNPIYRSHIPLTQGLPCGAGCTGSLRDQIACLHHQLWQRFHPLSKTSKID